MPPSTPNPNYDFILKDEQAPKRGLLSMLPGIPRPALIGGIVAIAGLLIVILYSAINSGAQPNYQPLLNAISENQEIARVSTEVEQLATDSATQNLASTVETTLSSEQTQLTSYISGLHNKNLKIPTSSPDTDTDTQMKNASTNGNLATIYAEYLKTQLGKYSASLDSATNATGPKGKALLSDIDKSVQVILQTALVSST